jgi:CheY-like chemotaxis protein
MPGIDGLDTYRQIRRILPCAVIVMMTGFAEKGTLLQAQNEGAYTVIHKPFSIAEIKNIIDKLVPAPEEKKLNIMVIDDDQAILGFFSKLLENKKQRFKVVDNGDEALRAMKEKKFDLVFLDLVLKGIDGAEVYKSIRRVPPDTAVIIITAYPQKAEKLAGEVQGCIPKPFEIGHILEYIEKVKNK